MRLSDIMSHMNLALFPEIALVIFLLVFLAVTVRVFASSRHSFEAAAALPLDDGPQIRSDGEPHV